LPAALRIAAGEAGAGERERGGTFLHFLKKVRPVV
jgi:hypothetical protein